MGEDIFIGFDEQDIWSYKRWAVKCVSLKKNVIARGECEEIGECGATIRSLPEVCSWALVGFGRMV